MGTWRIGIVGCGAHDNPDFEGDADRLAKDFVALLKAHGQKLEYAEFMTTDGSGKTMSVKSLMGVKHGPPKG